MSGIDTTSVAQSFLTSLIDGNAQQAALLLDEAGPSAELLDLVEDFRDVYLLSEDSAPAERLRALLSNARSPVGLKHRQAKEALRELAALLRRTPQARLETISRAWRARRLPIQTRFAPSKTFLGQASEALLTDKRRIFELRAKQYPVLKEWLKLKMDPVKVRVEKEDAEKFLQDQYIQVFQGLIGVARLLVDKKSPLSENQKRRLGAALAKAGISRAKNQDGTYRLFLPRLENLTLSEEGIKHPIRVLEELRDAGHIDEEDLDSYRQTFSHLAFIVEQYQLLQKEGSLTYEISLWDRSEPAVRKLNLPPGVMDDPSINILLVRDSQGEILEGLVLRLFFHPQHRGIFLLSSFAFIGRAQYQRVPEIVWEGLLHKVAEDVVKGLTITAANHSNDRIEQYGWSALVPLFPVTAPLGVERALSDIEKRFPHAYQQLDGIWSGGHEAMRWVPRAKSFQSPWLGNNFPLDLNAIVSREIEPNPDITRVQDYFWGVAGSNGRSVDYYFVEGWKDSRGTHWHHLSGIGVGRTLRARAGSEKRDGKLSLEVAWQRFYLTNLMNAIARDVGFRTSLGVAVVNFQRKRRSMKQHPGIPRIEAAVYELRREQLRLSDLMQYYDRFGIIVDYVRKKVARELGRENMTRAEYVRWLARTLGEQFAIMEYFGFDHGTDDGDPQLHPGNVSLMGEIFDFDTAHFVPGGVTRYRDNPNMADDHVDMEHIRMLQEKEKRPPKKGESPVMNWLGLLLYLAPGLDFYGELRSARYSKLAELRRLRIDPRKRIRDFNRRHWVPFMKKANGRPSGTF